MKSVFLLLLLLLRDSHASSFPPSFVFPSFQTSFITGYCYSPDHYLATWAGLKGRRAALFLDDGELILFSFPYLVSSDEIRNTHFFWVSKHKKNVRQRHTVAAARRPFLQVPHPALRHWVLFEPRGRSLGPRMRYRGSKKGTLRRRSRKSLSSSCFFCFRCCSSPPRHRLGHPPRRGDLLCFCFRPLFLAGAEGEHGQPG